MAISKEIFGKTNAGETAYIYTITNSNGMVAKVTNFGGILVSLEVPDRVGNACDVVLGYDKLENYVGDNANLGAIIGRNANRIGGASFVLNGNRYVLDDNDGGNNLHIGFDGYNNKLWDVETYEDELGQTVALYYTSPDGEQGFPGTADIVVRYIFTDDNCVILEYEAECDRDTVMNLTNHSYFNLSGHASGNVFNQDVWIDSEEYAYAGEDSIVRGEIRKVAGTPMDFRSMKSIGKDIKSDYDELKWCCGYDRNYVLKTIEGEVSLVAKMESKESGISMEVYTDLPGMHFYTGNFLGMGPIGKNGVHYGQYAGVCFETQYFPNAINVPSFKQPILKKGDLYTSTTAYKFLR